jgi:hypothetical protein
MAILDLIGSSGEISRWQLQAESSGRFTPQQHLQIKGVKRCHPDILS